MNPDQNKEEITEYVTLIRRLSNLRKEAEEIEKKLIDHFVTSQNTCDEKLTYSMMITIMGYDSRVAIVTVPNNEISDDQRKMIEFLSQDYNYANKSCKPIWEAYKNLIENQWAKHTIDTSLTDNRPGRKLMIENKLIDTVYCLNCWWCESSDF